MPAPADPRFRAATSTDARAIAALHADSWRRHYRGAYSDGFLDGDLLEDRLTVWSERLGIPRGASRTILAEVPGELVGFVHVVFDVDAHCGALIDNLHVVPARKGRGVGTRLLARAADAVLDRSSRSGIYLWVLEQNAAARAFYSSRGALCVGRDAVPPPGGDPAALHGQPVRLRYAWRHASQLGSR